MNSMTTGTSTAPRPTRLVLLTGLSGSGKSVALRHLEDEGYYCVDNLPANLLQPLITEINRATYPGLAISIDARSSADFEQLHNQIVAMRAQGQEVHSIFLTANNATLMQRFSETRRRHPLSRDYRSNAIQTDADTSLKESIDLERARLAPLIAVSTVIDTGALKARQLHHYLNQVLDLAHGGLTLLIQSFGFKHGLPLDADVVFDARCLPNPYYDPELRSLSGLDQPVQAFLQAQPDTAEFIADIEHWVVKWLPKYEQDDRSYLTIAIGCTGGQHRSVYIAHTLAQYLITNHIKDQKQVLVRHRTMKTAS